TTLALGPIVAACGLPVAKMSGRGLSHTGGTIDKLESIPGWSPDVAEAQFRHQLQEIGLVVAGQTADLAPADRALYALRDVTGTVPSQPLIAASIMSKKLAAGADAIVLDVKCGRGALLRTRRDAQALAQTMVNIGARAGRAMTALITQMDQPLGQAVGHGLEVVEAIAALQGDGPPDFQELVETLAVEMLLLGKGPNPPGAVADAMQDELRAQLQDEIRGVIQSGAALEKFRQFVAAQGGDVACVDDPARLAQAAQRVEVAAPEAGYIQHIDTRDVGLAVVELGGGRRKKDDAIDHAVGVLLAAKVGARVAASDTLCTIHARDRDTAQRARESLLACFHIGPDPVETLSVILARVKPDVGEATA
ncbi:MAG: thymidine phosphorylase, partial [Litorilinea sp.]